MTKVKIKFRLGRTLFCGGDGDSRERFWPKLVTSRGGEPDPICTSIVQPQLGQFTRFLFLGEEGGEGWLDAAGKRRAPIPSVSNLKNAQTHSPTRAYLDPATMAATAVYPNGSSVVNGHGHGGEASNASAAGPSTSKVVHTTPDVAEPASYENGNEAFVCVCSL